MNNNYPLPNYSPNNQPAQHTHFITETALFACGFEQATRSSTPRQIWNIHPHGGTAMRDALIYGDNLMMQLHDLLEREHTAENWNFIHVMITDGHDTDSNATFQEALYAMSTLRQRINTKDLKVIILGVDIEYSYANILRRLTDAAGIHGEYHDITQTNITQMFQKVRSNIGMGNQRPGINMNLNNMQNKAGMSMDEQHYAVLFSLDISGSMSGHKWDVTRHAVVDFIRYLGNNDIVSAVVFNDNPHLVMHWNTRQNQMQMNQMGVRPFQQIMANQAYYDPSEFGGPSRPLMQQGYSPYNGGGGYQGQGYNQRVIVQDPYYQEQCCCAMI